MRQRLFASLCLLTAAAAAHGQSATTPATDGPHKPLWEIGAFGFGVSQQAYPGADKNVNRALVLPYFLYRGPVLRIDGDTAGVRALKTPTVEVDVGFAGAFGSSANRVEARRGMPSIGTLGEVGPRVKWNIGPMAGGQLRANFPLRAVFDLSHHFVNRGVAFEPELVLDHRAPGGWSWSTGVGAVFGSRKLADTFYGVAPAFVTPTRPAYQASAGLIALRFGASASRSLSPDWRFFSFARLDSVAGAANADSPLVRRRTGATIGAGLSYTWLRSDAAAAD